MKKYKVIGNDFVVGVGGVYHGYDIGTIVKFVSEFDEDGYVVMDNDGLIQAVLKTDLEEVIE